MISDNSNIVTTSDAGGQNIAQAKTVCCSYCGQVLNSRFYFCPSCSQPYKPVDSLLSPVIIPQLSLETLIRQRRPMIMKVFWSIAACLFIVAIIHLLANYSYFESKDGEFASRNFGAFMLLNELIITGCMVFFFIPERRRLLPQLTNTGLFSSGLWIGLAGMIPLLAINLGVNYLSQKYLDKGTWADWLKAENYSLTAAILIISICPAVVEEILFRGIIQRNLLDITSPTKAIVYTSFLFTMIHVTVLGFPYIFVLSLLIGWVHLRTKSLYPPMILHALNNFFVIFVQWNWDRIFIT